MRVSSHGGLLGPVDEDDMKALRAQLDNVDIPPLPQSFRGESYGTNQLLMSWQEKEVGPLGCSFPSSIHGLLPRGEGSHICFLPIASLLSLAEAEVCHVQHHWPQHDLPGDKSEPSYCTPCPDLNGHDEGKRCHHL